MNDYCTRMQPNHNLSYCVFMRYIAFRVGANNVKL
jgi:hypothetical protein